MQASTSHSASATVNIAASASNFSVSPSAITVPAGAAQSFTAQAGGVTATGITWQVNGVTGGNAATGTINASGSYTAPLLPPPTGAVTITAISGSSGSATGVATISFSNASLSGAYAFQYQGQNGNEQLLIAAGSFVADGHGSITRGLEDVNAAGSAGEIVISGGTYTVGPDGRVSVQATTATNGTEHWKFALATIPRHRGSFVRFDTSATGSGTIDAQDTTAVGSIGSVQGTYVLELSGIESSGNPLAIAGNFLAGGGLLTQGVLDVNDGGSVTGGVSLVAGAYSLDSSSAASGTGRGLLILSYNTLPQLSFAFYIVDSTHIYVIEEDTLAVTSGDARIALTPFSAANLNGNYAFTVGGSSTAGPFASGGVFSANGASITAGTEDINNAGSVTQNVSVNQTASTVDPGSGRGSFSINDSAGTFNFAFYTAADGSADIIELDSTIVASGNAFLQSGALSASTVQGGYALNLTGNTASGEIDIAGQLTANGAGAFTGYLDTNMFTDGSTAGVGALSASLPLSSSTYSVGSNGRGTAALQVTSPAESFPLGMYVVNKTTALFIELDNQRVLLGTIEQQF